VSIVWRHAGAAPLLTLAGGVAAADGIRLATGLPVCIKWPNDVVVSDGPAGRPGRKLAGILAEGSTGPEGLQYAVLGFGINVRPAAYPPSIAARVTSIERELGRAVDEGMVLAEMLSVLNDHATALAGGDTRWLLDRWRELAPSAVGARVEWTENGTRHRGTTSGIDDQGALLVRTEGRVARIIAGEVTWL
jgi:BirA family biotin operon repressor/biotin-[acetyl-CoA-carboxylase] ligase